MRFILEAFEPSTGSLRQHVREGGTAAQARQWVEAQGDVVLSCKKERAPSSATGRTNVAWWCRELHTLLSSGMTVVEGLETLSLSKAGASTGGINGRLLSSLREGKSMSEAMRAAAVFPPILVAGVQASERTSSLPAALEEYVRYHDTLAGLQRKVVSAAVYPAVVASLGLLITLLLLTFVVPRFASMYTGAEHSLGAATRLLLGVSHALKQYGSYLGVGAVVAGGALVLAWRRGRLSGLVSRAVGQLKFVQSCSHPFRLAKLYQTLAVLLRGGYALADALLVCEGLNLGEGVSESVRQVRAEVAKGRRVSDALAQAGLADAVTLRVLAAGERSGQFESVLQTVHRRHAMEFETFIERATRIVEPLMLLAVSLLVGGIVVLMYMPVFDMAGSIR